MKIRDTIDAKSINWRQFAPAFVLVVNSLIWYTLTYAVFSSTVEAIGFPNAEKFAVYGVYYAGIAVSAIIGGIVFASFKKKWFDNMDGSWNHFINFNGSNFIK